MEVVDLRTLAATRPRNDFDVGQEDQPCHGCFTEAQRTGGSAGDRRDIAEKAFEWLDAPIARVASIDTPVPYSPPLEDTSCRRWMISCGGPQACGVLAGAAGSQRSLSAPRADSCFLWRQLQDRRCTARLLYRLRLMADDRTAFPRRRTQWLPT